MIGVTLGRVLAVAAKEAKAIRRDKALVKAIIAQVVIITTIFGFAVKTELSHAEWTVYDGDHSSLSRELVDRIGATGQVAKPSHVDSYEEVERIFRAGDASSAAVVIPRGFARSLERGERATIQLLLNGADTFCALRFSTIVTDVARRFPESSEARRRELRPHETGEPTVVLRRSLRFNPKREDLWFFIPTAPAVFLTQLFYGCACMAIAAERERLTYEHLLALPLRPPEILAGKAIPFFVIGFVIAAVYYLLFAPLACGIEVRGSIATLALSTFLFFVDAYLVAALASAVARNMQQAVYTTVFTVLPSTVISGFLVPTSTMPHWIQVAALALPTTHYVTLLRAIVVRGAPIGDLAVPLLSLGIIGAVTLTLLLIFFPRRVA